jgi:hypothetical protein
MPWLRSLAAVEGPRWSVDATWADDPPAVGADEWQDETTWDAAHAYDEDADVTFGLFVEGVDLTEWIQTASWGLGQADPFPRGVSPQSGSFAFRSTTETQAVAVGDRVVALTKWDTLWVGTVESVETISDPSLDDVISVSAVDDVARPSIDVPEQPIGGLIMPVLANLLNAMGLGAKAWASTPDDVTPPAWPTLDIADRSGSALSLIGDVLWYSQHQGAWTPYGLRIAPLELAHVDGYPVYDPWDDLNRKGERKSVEKLYNRLRVYDDVSDTTYKDSDSIARHAERPLELDYTDWHSAAGIRTAWRDIWEGDSAELALHAPRKTFRAGGNVKADRHLLTRILPFDSLADGSGIAASVDVTGTPSSGEYVGPGSDTVSLTVPADADALIVSWHHDINQPVVAPTFGGKAMTLVDNQFAGSGAGSAGVYVYELLDLSGRANDDLVFTVNQWDEDRIGWTFLKSATGTIQRVDKAKTNGSGNGPISVNLDAGTDTCMAYVAATADNPATDALTPYGSQVQQYEGAFGTGLGGADTGLANVSKLTGVTGASTTVGVTSNDPVSSIKKAVIGVLYGESGPSISYSDYRRVHQVRHRVTPDAWAVELEGVYVADESAVSFGYVTFDDGSGPDFVYHDGLSVIFRG